MRRGGRQRFPRDEKPKTRLVCERDRGFESVYTGTINQLVHLWKFDDDADRRAHWAAVHANKDFVEGFASKFRPLLMTQEVKLLQAGPWGPHP